MLNAANRFETACLILPLKVEDDAQGELAKQSGLDPSLSNPTVQREWFIKPAMGSKKPPQQVNGSLNISLAGANQG